MSCGSISDATILQVDEVLKTKMNQQLAYLHNKKQNYGDIHKLYNDFIDFNEQSKDLVSSARLTHKKYASVDELTEELTFGAHKTFDDMVTKSDSNYLSFIHNRLEGKLIRLVGLWDNPVKMQTASNYSRQFINMTKFFYNTYNKPNKSWMGIPINKLMQSLKIGAFFGHYGQAMRQYAPAQTLYKELEYITASIDNGSSSLKGYLMNVLQKHKGINLSETNLTSDDLFDMVKYTDPSFVTKWTGEETYTSINDAIFNKIHRKLIDQGITSKDDVVKTLNALRALKKDLDFFNYGDVEYDKRTKEFYTNNSSMDTLIKDKDGNGHPPFLRYMMYNAARIRNIISKIDPATLDKEQYAMVKAFNTLFGEGEDSFNIRSNYIPMKGEDTFLKKLYTDDFSRLYQNTNILKARLDIENEDNKINAVHALNNNLKIVKQLFTSISEMSTGLALKDQLAADKEFARTNELVHGTLEAWSDNMIEAYTKEQKRPSQIARAVKNYAQAGLALRAGVILTTAGPKNRMAATMYRSSLIDPIDYSKIKKQYLTAANSADWEKDLYNDVHTKTSVWDPMIKISDELRKESAVNYESAAEAANNFFSERLPDYIKAFGEKSMNEIFGMIKSENWAFNSSENKNLMFQKYTLYDQAKLAMQQLIAEDPANNNADVRKMVLDELSEDNFMFSKLGIGEYSKYGKPFWAWQTMRDADSILKTFLGYQFSKYAMFRMVMANNMDHAQRFMHQNVDVLKGAVGQSMGTAATSLAGLGLVHATIINELANMYLGDNSKVRLFGLESISPFEDLFTMGGFTMSLAKIGNHIPLTEYDADKLRSFFFMLGTNLEPTATGRFGAMLNEAGPESFHKFIEIPKPFSWDAMKGFGKAISNGLDYDSSYEQRQDMYKNINFAPSIMFNRSNDYLTYGADVFNIGVSLARAISTNDKKSYEDAGNSALYMLKRFWNMSYKIDLGENSYNGSDQVLNYLIKKGQYEDYNRWTGAKKSNWKEQKAARALHYSLNKMKKKLAYNPVTSKYFADEMKNIGELYE